jgi:hypothetical protein
MVDYRNNSINVTDTSQTFDLAAISWGYRTLWYSNDGKNSVYVCPWRLGENVVPCSAATGMELKPGEAHQWTVTGYAPEQGGTMKRGFVSLSVVCAAGQSSDGNRLAAFDPLG